MTDTDPVEGSEHGGPQAQADVVQMYQTPPLVKDRYPDIPESIPFYRPKVGHTLASDACYAVRCNDRYHDVKAAMEGERSHVRNAFLRAQTIVLHPCFKKLPVLIMCGFEKEPIKTGNKRLIDAAAERATLLQPTRRQLDIGELDSRKRFRLTGPTAAIQKYAQTATGSMHFSARPSHIEGATVASAILDEEDAAKAMRHVLVEEIDNILTSKKSPCQLTLRNSAKDAPQLLSVGLFLQENYGAKVYFRSYGTLRVTFPAAVTAELVAKIREDCGEFRVYTDTPLSAWGAGPNGDDKKKKKQHFPESEALKEAKQLGMVIARLEADYLPLPDRFEKVATALGGELLEVSVARFTDAPMVGLVAFTKDAWETAAAFSEPFEVGEDDGAWTVVLHRRPAV